VYRVLVPLDGSKFGEQALTAANALADCANVELKLVHAVDFLHEAQAGTENESWLHGAAASDASAYLETCAARVEHDSVSTAIAEGSPADIIQEEARDWNADLIVMSTHGFGAFDRAWLGSVADEVVRNTGTPVVLVRAGQNGSSAQTRFAHILIALDGSPLAEQSIPHALKLAGQSGARLTLLRVVQPVVVIPDYASPLQPPVFPESIVQLRQQQARDYITRVAESLRGELADVRAEVTVAANSDALEIIEYARAHDVDLIALATHGRSGLKRLVLGSVADKVIRGAPVPVLVIRPDGEPEQQQSL
jgi:nucleotide-binding universal stress UspA family protein